MRRSIPPFPSSLWTRLHFFGVIERRMLVEDLEDLRLCRLFVAFFHRAEFAREAARCRFEDLALRIALLGLVVGAEQGARHLGTRHEVARDRKSTRLNSRHQCATRIPHSARK